MLAFMLCMIDGAIEKKEEEKVGHKINHIAKLVELCLVLQISDLFDRFLGAIKLWSHTSHFMHQMYVNNALF